MTNPAPSAAAIAVCLADGIARAETLRRTRRERGQPSTPTADRRINEDRAALESLPVPVLNAALTIAQKNPRASLALAVLDDELIRRLYATP